MAVTLKKDSGTTIIFKQGFVALATVILSCFYFGFLWFSFSPETSLWINNLLPKACLQTTTPPQSAS